MTIKLLLKSATHKISNAWRFGWLATVLLLALFLGGITTLDAAMASTDDEKPNLTIEDFTTYPQLIKSYNITDASTVDKACFPTKGVGVIFQRAAGCAGSHHIWKVKDKLIFNEYDNDTASIIGTVIDDDGKIGKVNIALHNKSNQGNTWNAECYLQGITDPRSLYQSFNGTISIDGQSYSVELKQAEQHYIVADGAGFTPGQYGFGAWTAGTFGGCTEWFGNLNPIEVDCNITVDAGEDVSDCNIDEIQLTANSENAATCSNIISSYKIINSNTEAGCFTASPGVIFTKGIGCDEELVIWSANEDLELNEFDTNTAAITGSVTDQNGRIGIVNITLSEKEHSGTTWSASCYLDGISGPETFYRTFDGTITVDGTPLTVATRFNAHYILAQGAGFDNNQYGLGAWTGGSFGSCTEWFGNLVPKTIDNSSNTVNYVWSTENGNIVGNANQPTITVNKAGTYTIKVKDCEECEAIDTVVVTELPGPTVDAGDAVEVCSGEVVELTATTESISECPGGCEYPIEKVARCANTSNLSDVWLNNTSNANKAFITSTSKFETFDDGTAHYTAIGTNGIDNIVVDITFSGYTTTAPAESPKENNCETYDTSDWVYWTHTSGTIKTELHGTLIVSRDGPSMQLGNGADVTRTGFGASGWLTISGGDGFYTHGDVNLKLAECTPIEAKTSTEFSWSTEDGNIVGDANLKTITVDKSGTYTVTVADCKTCTGSDTVEVLINDKVKIGDYVWLDENRNGIQDESATGVKGIKVELHTCTGDLIDSTTTNSKGYYEFEVCQNSGDYYIVFGDKPEGYKYTASNLGDDANDSDADTSGKTECFTIAEDDKLTIDAGLIELCDINLEVVEEVKMCGEQILELSANLVDNTDECEGGCVYPIKDQDRCFGPEGNFEVWMVSVTDGKKKYHRFKASEQRFETLKDGSAKYTATATDGIDVVDVEAIFTGYSTEPGSMGPKANDCQDYDMSDWEYWSTWSGTISSKNHGIFTLSMKGAYFQMGVGADVVRSGFGASGWFYATGGDGYYIDGDINVALEECVEKSATFEWTTNNGSIISDANQKTISIDKPGTYIIKATNCIDCVATKKVVVTKDILCSIFAVADQAPRIAAVYPVPAQSGGVLTLEFSNANENPSGLVATSLKTTVSKTSTTESVTVILYDMMGRVIGQPKSFDIVDGKAQVYVDLGNIPSGKYIVKAQGGTWNSSKSILVK